MDEEHGSTNVYVGIPVNFTVGQISKDNETYKMSKETAELLPTTKKMRDAQVNDVFCQNLNEILQKGETLTVDEDGLLYTRVHINEATQIVALKYYRRTKLHCGHCPTPSGKSGARRMYVVFRKRYC